MGLMRLLVVVSLVSLWGCSDTEERTPPDPSPVADEGDAPGGSLEPDVPLAVTDSSPGSEDGTVDSKGPPTVMENIPCTENADCESVVPRDRGWKDLHVDLYRELSKGLVLR